MGLMCKNKTLIRKDIFSIIHAEISGKSALKISNEMNKADAILELLKLEKLVHACKTEGLTIFVKSYNIKLLNKLIENCSIKIFKVISL